MHTTSVGAFCQVWDSRSGDVVWEGTARSEATGGEFVVITADYNEFTRVAAQGLIENLFQTKFEKPEKAKSGKPSGDSRR
jgi:hypothetical protein